MASINTKDVFLYTGIQFQIISKGIDIFVDQPNDAIMECYEIYIRKEFQRVVGSTAVVSAVNHFSRDPSSGTKNTVFPRQGCSRTNSAVDF